MKKEKDKKSCLVIGYMNNNFGDDLFFDILFQRYPKVNFYMYPPSVLLENYKEVYKKYKNVIFYEEEDYYKKQREDIIDKNTHINLFPMICERAKKVDFYINIGGSIFIQNENWKNDDRFILKDIIKEKPAFIIGCNFGPGNQEYYDYFKKWFKSFDDVCFRDKNSYNKFKMLKNTRLADDIVLIKQSKGIIKPINYKKNIAISVIDIENNEKLKSKEVQYINFLIKTIKFYLKQHYNITLFSFCERDGDLKAINKIVSKLDEEQSKIKIVNYSNNINDFLKQWKKNKYVIGTRFHSIILSLAYKQAFIPISYSKKTNNYLSDIDRNIKVIDMKKIENEIPQRVKFNYIVEKYNSEEQFLKIDEYLKDGV